MKNHLKNFLNKNKKNALDSLTYLSFAVVVVIFASIVSDVLYQPKKLLKEDMKLS